MGVSSINRSSYVKHQPKVDTSTNMLCPYQPTTPVCLWSVCRAASHLRHLTASFDGFAGTPSVADGPSAVRLRARVLRSRRFE
jgi:hypothetical protein